MTKPIPPSAPLVEQVSRRVLLERAATLAMTGTLLATQASVVDAGPAPDLVAARGRIRQSIVQWCFGQFGERWSVEQTCRVARELGCHSVELVTPEHFATLGRYGLTCAIAQIDMGSAPPFLRGFNNPEHWPRVIGATREAIDAASAFGAPNVVCFMGYSTRNPEDQNSTHLSPEEGARNCVDGFRQIIAHAEEKGVTLCLEMLNSRDDSHPMKGHPGYQGDHVDYCIDIIRRVGSPRLKLLFDVYHVQIMDGDLIRRIHQCKDHIGHVHTAGNPGRGELDDRQEINYPAVMRTLVETGYSGYVGHEFIPTRDPRQGLRQAITVCGV